MTTTSRSLNIISGIAACLVWAAVSPVVHGAGAPQLNEAAQAKIKAAAGAKTPLTADGHPDLSGYWQSPAMGGGGVPPGLATAPKSNDDGTVRLFGEGADVVTVNKRMRDAVAARRANTSLRPKYKNPEDAAKALANFDAGDMADPTYGCVLPGVARLGLPAEIFQRPGAIVLLYEDLVNRYRVVPIDGSKLEDDLEEMPLGYPLGHWEGDTLVIETTGFVEGNWIDRDGSFHSKDLRMVEKFTRRGNTLHVDVVAHDPIWVEPFTVNSRTLVLAPAGTHVGSEYACNELGKENLVNGEKH
ncbi:MAG: hypothetical protein QM696_14090 [Steroidobacteraceae bacterium]